MCSKHTGCSSQKINVIRLWGKHAMHRKLHKLQRFRHKQHLRDVRQAANAVVLNLKNPRLPVA